MFDHFECSSGFAVSVMLFSFVFELGYYLHTSVYLSLGHDVFLYVPVCLGVQLKMKY